jgi:acetyltransferase-like isoleucine patch superfamily enzyme
MKLYKKYCRPFLRTSILKTIWFNWKMLPACQAWKLPIYLYGKTKFRKLTGKIIINGNISPGMIKIGKNDWYVDTSIQQCIWTIKGTIIFNGPISFGHGSYVLVSNNATLSFGTNTNYLGSNLKIMCFEKICFGNNVRITWDCQFYDTSFHYIESINQTENISPLTKPIIIGDRIWIGNRTTISKGAIIPNDTIVASNSLVNKDFSYIGPYCLLAGCPAIIKRKGVKRIFDKQREKELDKEFNYYRTHL